MIARIEKQKLVNGDRDLWIDDGFGVLGLRKPDGDDGFEELDDSVDGE